MPRSSNACRPVQIRIIKCARALSLLALAAACSTLSVTARAADAEPAKAAATVSYFKDVHPIFQVHCLGCHQPGKPMGEYVMTNLPSLFKGGESEQAAVVPGKPDESHLLSQITPVDGKA